MASGFVVIALDFSPDVDGLCHFQSLSVLLEVYHFIDFLPQIEFYVSLIFSIFFLTSVSLITAFNIYSFLPSVCDGFILLLFLHPLKAGT